MKAYRLTADLLAGLEAYRAKLESEDPDLKGEISESVALRKALRRFLRSEGLLKG